jgi:hypothetical protein
MLCKNSYHSMGNMRKETNCPIRILRNTCRNNIRASIVSIRLYTRKWGKLLKIPLKLRRFFLTRRGEGIIFRYLGSISWSIAISICGWLRLIRTHAWNLVVQCWWISYLGWSKMRLRLALIQCWFRLIHSLRRDRDLVRMSYNRTNLSWYMIQIWMRKSY